MDIRTEGDTEIFPEPPELYEPPMLEKIGGFAALTHSDGEGAMVDGVAYYPAR